MKRIVLKLSVLFFISIYSYGQIINVPGNQPTIQSAINASVDGDTVLVADGTYFENITFKGKAITVASHFLIDGDEAHIDSTIINGSQPTHPDSGSVVSFNSGEDTTSVLYGFTITGGSGNYWDSIKGPGGIAIGFSGAKIQYNKIVYNSVIHEHPLGGGIGIVSPAHPVIVTNNYIAYNKAQSTLYSNLAGGIIIAFDTGEYVLIAENVIEHNIGFGNNQGCGGGGICVWNSNSVIRNNLIKNNKAQRGGGIDIVDNENLKNAQPTILNNAILNNIATDFGGGIMGHYESVPQIPLLNNIIWGNSAIDDPQVSMGQSYDVIGKYEVPIEYSNVEGGYVGQGNIDLDPQFTDSVSFYLSLTSPCIDAGNPDFLFNDLEDENNIGFAQFPSLGGLRNDMGSYGGNPNMVRLTIPSRIILNYSVNNTYQVPGSDTLIVTSKIFRPENQLVEVKAVIESYDGSLRDSIPMFDDGTHNDNTAGDGFYTGYWPVTTSEKDYNIHISVNLTDYEYLVLLEKVAQFTTKGPIKFESMEVTVGNANPNPPERIKFTLTLINEGITDTIYDVNVNIISPDNPFIANSTTGYPLFGDIPPGESLTNTSRDFALTFLEGCSSDLYEFGLEITSNDIVYWYDTFSINVITGMEDEATNLPEEFELSQSYPNPFNPSTTIKYSLPNQSIVTLKVFDVLGSEIVTLVNTEEPQGNYEVEFEGSELTSGIYFYRLQAGDPESSSGQVFVETKKMILLK